MAITIMNNVPGVLHVSDCNIKPLISIRMPFLGVTRNDIFIDPIPGFLKGTKSSLVIVPRAFESQGTRLGQRLSSWLPIVQSGPNGKILVEEPAKQRIRIQDKVFPTSIICAWTMSESNNRNPFAVIVATSMPRNGRDLIPIEDGTEPSVDDHSGIYLIRCEIGQGTRRGVQFDDILHYDADDDCYVVPSPAKYGYSEQVMITTMFQIRCSSVTKQNDWNSFVETHDLTVIPFSQIAGSKTSGKPGKDDGNGKTGSGAGSDTDSISGSIHWQGILSDMVIPDTVRIHVYEQRDDGQQELHESPIDVDASDDWHWSISVPDKNGIYVVKEEKLAGYMVRYDHYDVTNTDERVIERVEDHRGTRANDGYDTLDIADLLGCPLPELPAMMESHGYRYEHPSDRKSVWVCRPEGPDGDDSIRVSVFMGRGGNPAFASSDNMLPDVSEDEILFYQLLFQSRDQTDAAMTTERLIGYLTEMLVTVEMSSESLDGSPEDAFQIVYLPRGRRFVMFAFAMDGMIVVLIVNDHAIRKNLPYQLDVKGSVMPVIRDQILTDNLL